MLVSGDFFSCDTDSIGELIRNHLPIKPGPVCTNISSLRIKNFLRNSAPSLDMVTVTSSKTNGNALFSILRLEMLVNAKPGLVGPVSGYCDRVVHSWLVSAAVYQC